MMSTTTIMTLLDVQSSSATTGSATRTTARLASVVPGLAEPVTAAIRTVRSAITTNLVANLVPAVCDHLVTAVFDEQVRAVNPKVICKKNRAYHCDGLATNSSHTPNGGRINLRRNCCGGRVRQQQIAFLLCPPRPSARTR